MSKISLKHSGGNVVSLNSPTNAPSAADVAFKLPNADGSAGQFMKTDGSGNLSFGAGSTATSSRTVGSAITLSNQSAVDFTGFGTIKRFDILLNAVSNTGADWGVRIGTGGSVDTSGYIVQSGYFNSSSATPSEANTGGFYSHGLAGASYSNNGIFRFVNVHHQTGTKWYCQAMITEYSTSDYTFFVQGYRTLSGALDIIKVLPESGTFDAGELRLVTYTD
jgi:hypothetical protein|tara:strand:+ start:476 stop:1138 length:663 start_codon:yes stop_codon:yes gene_type:complete